MNLSEYLRRVHCTACDWQAVWGPEQMLDGLRELQILRREKQPDPQTIVLSGRRSRRAVAVRACRHAGLRFEPWSDEFDDELPRRACEICGELIPKERLDIFPQATRCARCQDKPVPPPAKRTSVPAVAITCKFVCPRQAASRVIASPVPRAVGRRRAQSDPARLPLSVAPYRTLAYAVTSPANSRTTPVATSHTAIAHERADQRWHLPTDLRIKEAISRTRTDRLSDADEIWWACGYRRRLLLDVRTGD